MKAKEDVRDNGIMKCLVFLTFSFALLYQPTKVMIQA